MGECQQQQHILDGGVLEGHRSLGHVDCADMYALKDPSQLCPMVGSVYRVIFPVAVT